MNYKNKKPLVLVLSVVLIVGVVAVAAWGYNMLSADLEYDNLSENSDAEYVDFTVEKNIGSNIKLSDFEGKPVVLNFWASWCGPCKSEMGAFDAAYNEYKDEVEFMMVNLTDGYQETIDSAKEYVESKGYDFPVYFDTSGEAAKAYNVMSIPATYFIDEKGTIVAHAQGAINRKTLNEGIELLIK